MNRRSFLSSILTLGAAPTILPAALTYRRVWVPGPERFIVPFYPFLSYDLDTLCSLTCDCGVRPLSPDKLLALFTPTEYHGKAVLT